MTESFGGFLPLAQTPHLLFNVMIPPTRRRALGQQLARQIPTGFLLRGLLLVHEFKLKVRKNKIEVNFKMSAKDEDEPMKTVDLEDGSYPPLADGKYDIIILGTGLTECVVGGLLAVQGKKVLQLDRNNYYGSEAASLNLTDLFAKFDDATSPTPPEAIAKLGANRDYQVDLIPKFLMASGKMVSMLLHAQVTHYLDFKLIDGSFVFRGNGAGKPSTVHKVPSSGPEAIKTDLVGFFQKRRLKNLFMYLAKAYDETHPAVKEATLKEIGSMTAREM